MVVKRHRSAPPEFGLDQGVGSLRAEQLQQRREIAGRVRTWVEERQRTEPDYSVRQLSIACGWDGSHLGTVLRRLELGRDTRTETLRTIATGMGKPLPWLETGIMPKGVRLDTLEGWEELAERAAKEGRVPREAIDRFGALSVEKLPANLTPFLLAKMARDWADAM